MRCKPQSALWFPFPSALGSVHQVDLEDYVNRPEKISAADLAAICQEAGLQAVRENRYVVLTKDFDKAYKKHVNKADKDFAFYS